jgi:hypothetical protein
MNKSFDVEDMIARVYTLDKLMEYVRNRTLKVVARLVVELGCLAYQLVEMEKRGEPDILNDGVANNQQ